MPRLLVALFVLIALPACVMFAVLVPPGQMADEPAHIARAAALLHGQFRGERRMATDETGRRVLLPGVTVDPNLWQAAFVLTPGGRERMDAARLAAARALPWGGVRVFAETGTIAVYFPVLYIPAAIGIGVAKRLGLGPYDAILVGRLCGALCFVGLGAVALRLARRGRAVMFCVLTAPMTLALAGSFNQDGLLIAASTLAAALATRGAARSRWGATLLIGCVAIVKLPYLPLAALLLVQPGDAMRRRVVRAGLVAVPALAWTALMMARVATPVARPPHPGGPLWPGDPATIFTGTDPVAQLRVLLAEPARALWLPARTMLGDPWLIRQMIGVLGWLTVELPGALYLAWVIAFGCALLADLLTQPPAGPALGWPAWVLLPGAALLAIWGIYLSQYLTWTDVGLAHIDGPSGRYLLPLLPMMALAWPMLGRPGWRSARLGAIAVPVMVALAGLVVLPVVVVGAYYLR
jgi:hypothetical protein